jgi:galactokinase
VGTRGGIMDHFAALLTQRDHALFLDCRVHTDGSYLTRHIPFPASHRLLVVDSGVHHDNIRGEFNVRVAACRAGVALLRPMYPHITHLRDLQDIPWATLAPHLPEASTAQQLAATGIFLGDIPGLDLNAPLNILACCRHVWHENARVLQTLDALATGDITAVGVLLTKAHFSARDDYGISTPELDYLVNTAITLPGVAGARLTGAGWGGCVLILVDANAIDLLQSELGKAYAATFGYVPSMFLCQAAPGAGYLGTVAL